MIFRSAAMQSLLDRARRFADSSATVLINGESGTGKELLASWLHTSSRRADGPFLQINCGAIQPDLIASELFGHEQGAFTGAIKRRIGCLESAKGGTLLLDEIGELPISLQAMLLRVLEEQQFSRVGSHEPLRVDARIIAATNRDLARAVFDGTFREDLFHRLDVLTLNIPPLRERRDDIPLLAHFFVQESNAQHETSIADISDDVMDQLVHYHWSGNVRQLRNVVYRACLLTDSDTIQSVDLPYSHIIPMYHSTGGASHRSTNHGDIIPLKELERQAIMASLQKFDGHQTKAATALGITSRTLRNKLAEYRRDQEAA